MFMGKKLFLGSMLALVLSMGGVASVQAQTFIDLLKGTWVAETLPDDPSFPDELTIYADGSHFSFEAVFSIGGEVSGVWFPESDGLEGYNIIRFQEDTGISYDFHFVVDESHLTLIRDNGNQATYRRVPGDPSMAETSSPSDCLDGLPPRMVVGNYGWVPEGMFPQTLYDAPPPQGREIQSISETTLFIVKDGPVCSGYLNWWQIELVSVTPGVTGWLAEGSDMGYWIEPFVVASGGEDPTSAAPQATPVPEVTTTHEDVYGPDDSLGDDPPDPSNLWERIFPPVYAADSGGERTTAFTGVGECTALVARLRPDVFKWLGYFADAGVWDNRATDQPALNCGITVSKTDPRPGDIVVFEPGSLVYITDQGTKAFAGDIGHVGYITDVSGSAFTFIHQNMPKGTGPITSTMTVGADDTDMTFIHQPTEPCSNDVIQSGDNLDQLDQYRVDQHPPVTTSTDQPEDQNILQRVWNWFKGLFGW